MTASASTLVEPALRELVAAHGDELRRHLTGMLGTEDDAEDVLQEVWLTAHRQPPDLGPGSNVRAWLYRVATNAALTRLARDRRRRAALERRRYRLEPDGEDAPDRGLEALPPELRARVREGVARLPGKQRQAVWLRWVVGAHYGEIAERLGSSEQSARANVYQGMKKLRAELSDMWTEEYST